MNFMVKTYISLLILLVQVAYGQDKNQAIPFLPEIFGELQNVRDFTISNTEDEAYFTVQSPLGEISAVLMIKKKGHLWGQPEVTPFSGKFNDLEPFLSPDGLKLFFASNRPFNENGKAKDYDIWYVERKDLASGWSVPVNMGNTINTEYNEFYPSISERNNLFFTSDYPNSKGKDDIYMSSMKNGSYTEPVSLSEAINSVGYEFNAYVAPDESFLIFSGYNRDDGLGSGDLYISFKSEDNTWNKAKNLGAEVNSKQMDYCPYVNSKTGMMYFTSKRSSVTQKDFSTVERLMYEINKYENGLSRIYQVSIKEIILNKI